jgi:hypothetical protein
MPLKEATFAVGYCPQGFKTLLRPVLTAARLRSAAARRLLSNRPTSFWGRSNRSALLD